MFVGALEGQKRVSDSEPLELKLQVGVGTRFGPSGRAVLLTPNHSSTLFFHLKTES